MDIQQLINELHHLPFDQLETLRVEIDRLHVQKFSKHAPGDEAFRQFLGTVERYQTRYPEGFRFNRDEANER